MRTFLLILVMAVWCSAEPSYRFEYQVTPDTYCYFWNPNPNQLRVVATFYVDGQHFSEHDGILGAVGTPQSTSTASLVKVIPDLQPKSIMVLTAPLPFYSWCIP